MPHGILLVDAQRDVVRRLRSALHGLKAGELEILEAASGEEALLLASRIAVDLLVVDYQLPGMSGLELIRRIDRQITGMANTMRSESILIFQKK